VRMCTSTTGGGGLYCVDMGSTSSSCYNPTYASCSDRRAMCVVTF
jgi:hypothetical protein